MGVIGEIHWVIMHFVCQHRESDARSKGRAGQGRVNGFQMRVEMRPERLTVSMGSTINCLSSGILMELSALSKNVKCQMSI